jgi:hypothetical protein
MHTRPGMYAQYSGHVDVLAENDEDARELALDKLKRTSFPDYSRDMWKIDRVETR